MKMGYYICGVSDLGTEAEQRLFKSLYDRYAHCELSTQEVIDRILYFSGIEREQVNRYKEDYPEELYGHCISDGNLILSIGATGEDLDVYLDYSCDFNQ